jgi:hypothetical protein
LVSLRDLSIQISRVLISRGADLHAKNISEIDCIGASSKYYSTELNFFFKEISKKLRRLRNALRICRIFSASENSMGLRKRFIIKVCMFEIMNGMFTLQEFEAFFAVWIDRKTLSSFKLIPNFISKYVTDMPFKYIPPKGEEQQEGVYSDKTSDYDD